VRSRSNRRPNCLLAETKEGAIERAQGDEDGARGGAVIQNYFPVGLPRLGGGCVPPPAGVTVAVMLSVVPQGFETRTQKSLTLVIGGVVISAAFTPRIGKLVEPLAPWNHR
jgi:hypothetical protein